jgi:hypothetical protein
LEIVPRVLQGPSRRKIYPGPGQGGLDDAVRVLEDASARRLRPEIDAQREATVDAPGPR